MHRAYKKRMYNKGSAARLRVPAKRLRLRVPRVALLTIFVILLLGMLLSMQQPQRYTAQADPADAWWNSDWDYRQGFNVSAAGTYTSEQVEIWVNRSTGTSSGNVVYVGTKCEADYDDIRFTNDGASPSTQPYWIEHSNSSVARIWVQLDSVDADGEYFYIYYGYSSASAASTSGAMEYVDDFEDGDISGWNYDGSSSDCSSTQAAFGTYSLRLQDDVGGSGTESGAWARVVNDAGSDKFRLYCYYYLDLWINDNDTIMEGDFMSTRVYDDSASTFVEKDVWRLSWDDSNTADNYYFYQGTIQAGTWDTETYVGTFVNVYNTDPQSPIQTWYRTLIDLRANISVSVANQDDIYFELGVSGRETGGTDKRMYLDQIFVINYTADKTIESWESEETQNHTPTIENAATVTNLDDTDNLYANCRKYLFVTDVNDEDGDNTIDFVGVKLLSGINDMWVVWYDHQTTTWSEGNGDYQEYIELSTGDCSTSATGEGYLQVSFAVWIEFAHAQTNDFSTHTYVNDTEGAAAGWTENNVDYDVWNEPLLVIVGGYTGLTDNSGTALHGNINGALEYHARLTYTCTDFVPPTYTTLYADPTRCDIWVNSSGIGSWSGNVWYNSTSGYGEVHMSSITADSTTGSDQYDYRVVEQDAGVGGTRYNPSTQHNDYISDQLEVVITAPTYTHVGVSQNMTGVLFAVTYDYDDTGFDGTKTLNCSDWSQDVAIDYWITAGTMSGDTHGVTTVKSTTGEFRAYWENVTCTWSHFWTKYAEDSWFAHITISGLDWTSGAAVPDGATIKIYENESVVATLTVASNQVGLVRAYTAAWTDKMVNWTCTVTYTGGAYNINPYMRFYTKYDDVPIVHTLYVDVFDLEFTSTHVIISYETNWHNATLTVWINGTSPYYFASEGIKIVPLPTATGYWNFTLLINGTGYGGVTGVPSGQGTFDSGYTANDKWAWREFGYEVPDYVLAEHIITFAFYDGTQDCMFVVVSDLSAVYLKAWDNGSLVIPQTLITNILKFDKTMTYGWHNVTCQVGSTTYGWLTYYCGYDVVERIVYLDYYDAETGLGTGIDYRDVVTLINGTQMYFVPFWVAGNYVNITILDYYGQTIDSQVVAYDEHLTIGLTFYEVQLINIGADTVRAVIFYGTVNRTIELQPYEATNMRFVLNNYTVWEQFISGYDIEGNVDWTNYRQGVWELGTYQQVKKMQHQDWAERMSNPSANYALSVLSLLFMVIGGVSGAIGIYGYIQRRDIQKAVTSDNGRKYGHNKTKRKYEGE